MTLITETPSSISMDVVLSLKVKSSWPALTMNGFKIEKWLGTKAKQEYKRNPYYLVPKYEGIGSATKDGIRAMGEFGFERHIMPCIVCHVSSLAFQLNSTPLTLVNFSFGTFISIHFYTGILLVKTIYLIHTDTWRLSFSNIEKAIMMNHGSEKTCCEARGVHCCRSDSCYINHVGFCSK